MLPRPPLLIVSGLLLALVCGVASALGLGAMRTQSALNQPFYAEIEVNNVNVDELDTVKARLASREEFAKAGAERPHFLTRLSFTPAIGTDGRPYVQVSSREPIREPYIDFLVEVIWPQGRLVKEYTVLLDPPARGGTAPPRVVAPRVAAPVRRAPPEAEPAPALRGSPNSQAQNQTRAQQAPPSLPRPAAAPVPPQARGTRFPLYYGPVPRGATLTGIARELTPPGASVEQTAMALFRNNQNAFMRANINRLQVGVDLVVPTAEELFALDPAAARRQFQDALAGRSVNSSPITDVPADARLRIAASGGAPDPMAGQMPAQPPAFAGVPGAPADPRLRDDLLMVQETTESNRQETGELRNRISELESQLSDIQRLLQLRNQELAQLQRTAGGDALPAPLPPGVSEPLLPPAPGLPGEPVVPTAQAELEATLTGDPAGTDRAPTDPVVESGIVAVQPEGGVAELPPEAMAETETEVDVDGGLETGSDTDAAAGMEPTEDTSGEPFWAGPVETLTGVVGAVPPWALAAGAGTLLAGGLGLIAYRRRRDKTGLDLDLDFDELPEADGDAVAATAEAGPGVAEGEFELRSTTAGSLDLSAAQDVDSGAPRGNRSSRDDTRPAIDLHTGLPVSVITNLPASQQEMQESDVIAEADIYILYGRYREAEALLREELAKTSGRPDLRYKLGEALLGGGNAAALAELLGQMRAAGDDKHDAAKWATLENGLAALGPPAGSGESQMDQVTQAPPTIRPLDNVSTHIGADTALDVAGAESTGLTGASGDADLGFSVHEAMPSSADRLRDQMADLELDLQDMDGAGGNLESERSKGAERGPGLYTEELSDLGAEVDSLPLEDLASAPVDSVLDLSATPADGGGGDLDLDLDDLNRLTEVQLETGAPAAAEEDSEIPDLTLPVPDGLPEDLQGGELQDMLDALDPLDDPRPTWGEAGDSAADEAGGLEETGEAGNGPVEDSISSDVLSSQWRMDSGLWDEAATKIDLARAYIEMSDPDAARTILEEVVQEGSDAQRADAQALLDKIG